MRTRVLFVCAANAARSQMAEAILRSLGGHDFEVCSAGVRPHENYVITLCDEAREACASMTASVENIHWNITDPLSRGDSNEHVFRDTLWEVRRRVDLFVTVARARERPSRP
jgi:protein-tyrosine-phosphatase